MGAANCAAVLLSMPISHHFLRLYSATGRARRRKWLPVAHDPLGRNKPGPILLTCVRPTSKIMERVVADQ